jgi:hypothetical protein
LLPSSPNISKPTPILFQQKGTKNIKDVAAFKTQMDNLVDKTPRKSKQKHQELSIGTNNNTLLPVPKVTHILNSPCAIKTKKKSLTKLQLTPVNILNYVNKKNSLEKARDAKLISKRGKHLLKVLEKIECTIGISFKFFL